MLPLALTAEHFAKYPTQARRLAVSHLLLLRQLPLAFLPSLLQEVIEYDYKFPAERAELDGQLVSLSSLTSEQLRTLLKGFWQLRLTPEQEKVDWVDQPQRYTEQFSAYLWSTHQMDAFRQAAADYGKELQVDVPTDPQMPQRLGIAVIGQGVREPGLRLFEKLRSLGTYFSNVNPDGGLQELLAVVAERASAHPVPYAHWYVDGGVPASCSSLIHQVSYAALAPVRKNLLQKIQQQVSAPGMGPERLRDYLAQLTPEALGISGEPLLDRFKIKLLTEGSGTQIYSTTFAQWTAREVLRRSAAMTLLVRFAPRQRQRSMSELLANTAPDTELDPAGSLVDADMSAYYHWISQQRLPGHERSAFVAWFEGHHEAVIIGPTTPRGVTSTSSLDLRELITTVTA